MEFIDWYSYISLLSLSLLWILWLIFTRTHDKRYEGVGLLLILEQCQIKVHACGGQKDY